MAQQRDPRSGDGSTTSKTQQAQMSAQQHLNTPEAEARQHGTTPEKEHSTVPKLVRQLTTDVTSLFTKELSLARSEMRESVNEAKAGIMALTGGGVVLLAGMIVLLMAAVYGLATVLSLWLSALIVGGVVTIIGAIMLKSGQSKLKPDSFKPERTMREMKHDRDSVKKGAVQ